MRAARLYGALLGLLPPSVSSVDRAEIRSVFEALWRDADTAGRRLRVLVSSYRGLAAVIALEWKDYLGTGRARSRRKGDGMVGLWSGVRHGARSLVRTPSFAASAVLLLGLGIGAVTTIFSVVDHVVLRPLPYPESERLVVVEEGSHSGPTFRRFQTMQSVDEWAGVFTWDGILTGGEEPLRIEQSHITRRYFSMFGGRPAMGRLFVDSDYDGSGVVVLSHGLWQRVYGSDPGVVGRTIRIDGEPRVVVGVVASSFIPPEALDGANTDIYTPVDWSSEWFTGDGFSVLSVAGRLAPGATLEQARAEAASLAERRAEEVPDQFVLDDGSPQPLPVTPLQEATVGGVRAGLGLIFGAVTLLLLVACVNVAHLFMARGVERVREMGVRRALGAATAALARQLAIESLLVGLAGAAVGVVLALAGIGAFRSASAASLPRMDAIAVDVRVLAFAVVVGMATALLFGLLPALRLAVGGRVNPLRTAGRGMTAGRRAQTVRHGLVVLEIALSLVLAAQAGWLIRAFADLHATDLGFRTEDIWTIPVTPRGVESSAEWYRRMEGVRESLETVPGVRAAAFGLTMPLEFVGGSSCCWRTTPTFEGDDAESGPTIRAHVHTVTAGYFDLLALRLAAGRGWSRAEESALSIAEPSEASPGAGSPGGPAVISEPLAIEQFGAVAEAIGKSVTLAGGTYTIIGVVANNRHYGPTRENAAIYIPAPAIPFPADKAVLTDGPQEGLPRMLAEAVWRVEPDLPVPVVRSMDDWARRATARARLVSSLFTAFGVIALLLVVGGLAGTLLYMVRIRRRELGIRMALGATPAGVKGSVLRTGVALALGGIVLGGAATWLSGRAMEGMLAGVEARDAGTFGLAVAVLLTVALVASWVPARRAARTDPMATLRVE